MNVVDHPALATATAAAEVEAAVEEAGWCCVLRESTHRFAFEGGALVLAGVDEKRYLRLPDIFDGSRAMRARDFQALPADKRASLAPFVWFQFGIEVGGRAIAVETPAEDGPELMGHLGKYFALMADAPGDGATLIVRIAQVASDEVTPKGTAFCPEPGTAFIGRKAGAIEPGFYADAFVPAIQRLAEAEGWVALHAGVVVHGDRAIAVLGRSGAGKSTLCRALAGRAGFAYLGDDITLVRVRTEAATDARDFEFASMGLFPRFVGPVYGREEKFVERLTPSTGVHPCADVTLIWLEREPDTATIAKHGEPDADENHSIERRAPVDVFVTLIAQTSADVELSPEISSRFEALYKLAHKAEGVVLRHRLGVEALAELVATLPGSTSAG